MAGSAYKSARNYFSTYLLLGRDYVAFLGAKAIPIVAGVVAAGLIYPLPFAIMAAAVYAMMSGQHTSVINLQKWKFEIDVDSAFLYALLLAGMTLVFNYLTARIALAASTAWQTSLLWRAVNQLPVMARWDTDTAIPLPLRIGRLGPFLTAIVRSGFLIGRMVAIGLTNLIFALAALLVLAWLDPLSVGVLIGMAVLFLPIYAWALLRMVELREKHAGSRQQQQAMLRQVLEQGITGTERRIDVSRLSAGDAQRFSSGYAIVNDQLQSLNLISLILGLHVFASIAVIYLINGASLSTFVRDKVVFFVVLIFMMRSALSLALLMSRLSRSYVSLATLRAYLHPKRKRVERATGAPEDARFALEAKQGERHYVTKGDPVFVIIPGAAYVFELLPLSNALHLVAPPKPAMLRHIVFFDAPELESLLAGGAAQTPPLAIEISDSTDVLHLPVLHVRSDPAQLFVVALSTAAWELLVRRGQADAFCAERVVFVVMADPKRPQAMTRGALLVVSDGAEIIAVGPFSQTWESFAEEAFRRARKKDVKIDIDETEELA